MSRVTILSILLPQEEHIVNIVTPRETYTKIHSAWRTIERLSNVYDHEIMKIAKLNVLYQISLSQMSFDYLEFYSIMKYGSLKCINLTLLT